MGYIVVDVSIVVVIYINQVMLKYFYEFLGFEEVQKLLENLQKVLFKLVENLVLNLLFLSKLYKVL